MATKYNLRFCHKQSHEQLFELSIDSSISVGELKVIVCERLAEADECPVRVFHSWYYEIPRMNDDSRQLTQIHEQSKSLKDIGLVDECIVLLEGPLDPTEMGHEVAIMSANANRFQYTQTLMIREVMGELAALRKDIALQRQEAADMAADNSKQRRLEADSLSASVADMNTQLAEKLEEVVAKQLSNAYRLGAVTMAMPSISEAELEAVNYLAKHKKDQPLDAFWDALSETKGPLTAMAIVNSQSCGMEKKSATRLNRDNLVIREATPLIMAVHAQRLDIVQALVAGGADIAAYEEEGRCSPLHVAAINGHVGIIELLVSKGADLGAANHAYGATPLHLAASNARAGAIKALINGGAVVNAMNNANRSPLQSFEMYGSARQWCDETERKKILALFADK